MHSVTTEQNNSHYFKFFKRPHEYYQKIGTQSILEEYNLGPSHLLTNFYSILVGDFFETESLFQVFQKTPLNIYKKKIGTWSFF